MSRPYIVRCCGCGGWKWVQKPRKCLTCGATNYPPTAPLYPLGGDE